MATKTSSSKSTNTSKTSSATTSSKSNKSAVLAQAAANRAKPGSAASQVLASNSASLKSSIANATTKSGAPASSGSSSSAKPSTSAPTTSTPAPTTGPVMNTSQQNQVQYINKQTGEKKLTLGGSAFASKLEKEGFELDTGFKPDTPTLEQESAQIEGTQVPPMDTAKKVNEQDPYQSLLQQINSLGVQNKAAYDQLVSAMGESTAAFQEQLSQVQSSTGRAVDLQNQALQQELIQAQERGESDFKPILDKYLGADLGKAREAAIDTDRSKLEAMIAQAESMGVSPKAIADAKLYTQYDRAYTPQFIAALEKEMQSAQLEQDDSANMYNNTSSGTEVFTNAMDDGFNDTDNSVTTALADIGSSSFDSLYSQVTNMDLENMTPAQILQTMLKTSLGTLEVSDKKMRAYFDKMETMANDSYKEGLQLAKQGIKEVDKVIDGKNIVPQTFLGLNAKVLKDAADFNQESIELERDYMTERFGQEMDRERDKRARLDGYLKAKMYAAGAQDSTAGLALLALQTDAADLRLQQMTTDQTFALSKLNLESRRIKTDYANSIVEMNLTAKADQDKAKAELDDKLFQIQGLRLQNDQEKQQLMLNTIQQYGDKMATIKAQQESQKLEAQKFAYQQSQDMIDRTYKQAGVTGTVWKVGANGQLEDTGIPTFEAQKYDQQYQMELWKTDWQMKNDAYGNAIGFLETMGNYELNDDAKAYLQNLFPGDRNIAGMQYASTAMNYVQNMQANLGAMATAVNSSAGGNIDQALLSVSGKGIQRGGMQIDPTMFNEVRSTLSATGATITQSFKPWGTDGTDGKGKGHAGIDYVVKGPNGQTLGAEVASPINGKVVEVRKWNGDANGMPYGHSMVVQDNQGVLWQFAHLGDRRNPKATPFLKGVGETVQIGDVLGLQGNTGRVLSNSRSQSDPNYGVHVDLRVVGHSMVGGQTAPAGVSASASSSNSFNFNNISVTKKTVDGKDAGGDLFDIGSYQGKGLNALMTPLVSNIMSGSDGIQTKEAQLNLIKSLSANGMTTQLVSNLKQSVASNLSADEKKKFDAVQRARQSANELEKVYNEYVKAGGKTGLVIGNTATIQKKLGSTNNPKLAELQNRYAITAENYLRDITGAAATDPEYARVTSMLPKITDGSTLTKANLKSFADSAQSRIDYYYQNSLGSDTYKNVYKGLFRAQGVKDLGDGFVQGTLTYNGKPETVYFDLDSGSAYKKSADGKTIRVTFP